MIYVKRGSEEMEYVMLKSYDDKIVRVPIEKKEEYEQTQIMIKKYIESGKKVEEIKNILKEEENDK